MVTAEDFVVKVDRVLRREYKYAVIITTYGNWDLVKKCRSSIPEYVRSYIIDTKRMGWPLAKAWNYALDEYDDYDALIITNDDVVFLPNSIEDLVDCLLRRQYVDGITPECLVVKAWDKKGRQYYRVDELTPGWRNWYNEGWFCFATSKRLFEKVGRFDENFDPCYGEDTDMAYRIHLAGYGAISYSPVWHESAGSTKNDPERAAFVEEAKRKIERYFVQKWGELPSRGPIFEKLFNAN